MRLSCYSFAATLLPLPLTAVYKQLFPLSGLLDLQLHWLNLQFSGTLARSCVSNLIHTVENSAKPAVLKTISPSKQGPKSNEV